MGYFARESERDTVLQALKAKAFNVIPIEDNVELPPPLSFLVEMDSSGNWISSNDMKLDKPMSDYVPEGLYVILNFLTEEEEQEGLHCIRSESRWDAKCISI